LLQNKIFINGVKVTFKNCISMFILSTVLCACGGGGGSAGSNSQQSALSTTAGDSVVIPLGTFKQYGVLGGVPPYQVSSSDSLVASGVLNGTSLTVEARDGGSAKLRVTDRVGTAVTIGVSVGTGVPLYTSAPDDLIVGESAKRIFRIAGGTPFNIGGVPTYRVEGSNNSVAAVVQTGPAEWSVIGKVLGAGGVVKIFDATTVKGINVTVAVPAMSISPVDVKIPVGLEFDVLVSGGQPPYALGGNIPTAVQVSPASSPDGRFKVKGSELAQIDLTFIDAAAQSIKTKVEINSNSRGFRIAPSPMSISELNNESLAFSMYGFLGDATAGANSGQVCVYVSDPTYAALDRPICSSYSASGRSFNITLGTRGNRCVSADKTIDIRAVDSEQKVANATLIISDSPGATCGGGGNGDLQLLPSNTVTLSDGASATLLIVGGTGAYAVTSTNPASVSVSVSGNVLTVTGGATAGTATVVVTDKGSGKSISRDVTR
jgi:hypothetical protein